MEINVLMGHNQFIKSDHYPKEHIPKDILDCLEQRGYHEPVLQNDQWQYFLIPIQTDTVIEASF